MNTNDITVMIDMDDVLEDLVTAWCEWLNHKYGTNVKKSDVTNWNITDFFPSLTKDEVFAPTHLDEFWLTVKPLDGAQEYVKRLVDDGFQIYIVTASDYRTIKVKFEDIIQKFFPCIEWCNVIVAKKKQMVCGDILIDDGIHNLEGGQYHKILMSTPHNQFYDAELNGMVRVTSWNEAYNEVHRYVEQISEEGGKMNVIKRNGAEVEFNKSKIYSAIQKANEEASKTDPRKAIKDEAIVKIVNRIYERCRKRKYPTPADEISDMTETELMKEGAYLVAQCYIRYRCSQPVASGNEVQ